MIGQLVDEFSFAVEAGKVREFARAILAPSAAGVPLTFSVVAGHHRDARAAVDKLGLDIKRVVVGEVEWAYERPLVVGDELSARRVVADVKTREGSRGGTMTLVTLETEFRDAAGAVALRQREVLIETGGA
jgi:hydroxyacyl-ACP dehydratase HTD2-like protein with hotdog domain